ncbi:TonB-dependent receptor [Hirschia litorea]|uniref:TonB-dependent receptor n=1 Tax=Hirschia litorea TaxID=1199156 RepID=A0ABW2IPG3_9PROT
MFFIILLAEAVVFQATAQERYELSIPSSPVPEAFKSLSYSTGHSVLFQTDDVETVRTNAINGRMTVSEALNALLEGTSLKGGLTESGVITVSVSEVQKLKKPRGDNMKTRSFKKSLFAGLATTILGVGGANAQSVEPTDVEAENPILLETIVVTGIRKSLSDAVSMKKNASSIVDVISAEDIGKLPDQNVAEALQRINGVQIRRRNGEGAAIAIRGLRDNRIEVGGATLVNPTGRNNGPNESTFNVLQFLPSQMFSGLEVAKSPTADLIEGGIGGHVQLHLRKPLEFDDFTVSYTAEGVYSKAADAFSPRGSVLVADTVLDGKLGYLFSASHDVRKLQEDVYYTRGTEVIGSADSANTEDFFFVGNESRWQDLNEDRTRTSFSAGLQWQPTDALELYLNGFYAEFGIERVRNWLSVRYGGGSEGPNFEAFDNKVISDNRSLLAAEYDTLIQGNGEENDISSHTASFVTGAEFSQDALNVKTEFTIGESEQIEDQNFLRAQSLAQTRVGVDFRPTVPSIQLLDAGFDILDPLNFRNNVGFNSIRTYTNEELSGRVDVDYEINNSPLTSIELGMRYSSSSFERSAVRSSFSGASGTTLADFPSEINPVASISNVFGEHPQFIFGPSASGGQGVGRGPAAALNPSALTESLNEAVVLDEKSMAAYLKANFSIETKIPVSGNVGIRAVNTDLIAKTPAIGVVAALNLDNSYTDYLPSLNVKADLRDDIALRYSYSKVMSRPPTFDLLPAFGVDVINGFATSGNPSLDPFRANAHDLSLEWYIDDTSMLSAALFRKESKSFLVRRNFQETIPGLGERVFTVSRPTNGAPGTITGLELAAQKTFDSGFGFIANYTYADGGEPNRDPSTTNGGLAPLPSGADVLVFGTPLGLEGLSEHSYNLVGFYETDKISLRAAYNYRSEFLEVVESVATGGSVFQKGSGQLDLSGSYNILSNLALTFDAVNILDTQVNQYSMFEDRRYRVAETGPSLIFGVRGTF